MKKLLSIFCALMFVTIINCGSSGSGSSLTSTQVNAISAALTGAMSQSEAYTTSLPGINSDVNINSTSVTCSSSGLTCTGTVNETYNCAAGGHITAKGNMSIYCTSTTVVDGVTVCASGNDYNASMQITFYVSDPTNNLNDCNIGNGVVLDGTVSLSVSGNVQALTATITGTIDIDTVGTSGGLTPIASSCYILLDFPAGGTPSGSICGNTVSATSTASLPEAQF
jgi:hypothetical protein